MFRLFLAIAVLFCLGAELSLAETPAQLKQLKAYIDKGCPAPQRIWTGAEYEALRKAIDTGTIPLPRADDPVLSPVFKRMVNPKNLEAARHGPDAFRAANRIGATLPPLIVLYRKGVTRGEPLEGGVAALTALLLQAASISYAFAPEPSDLDKKLPGDVRATRSMARDNMRDELLHIFDGVIRSIERGTWSDSSRVVFAKAVAESLPLVRAALPQTDLKDYKARLEACRQKKNSAELNEALKQAIAATEGAVILNT